VAVVVLLLVAGGVAFAVSKVKTATIKPVTKDAVPAVLPSIPATDEATPTVAVAGESTAAVEVPSVIGKPVTTGVTIVDAAGLKAVTRVADKAVAGTAPDAVVAQDPPQGAKVPSGTTVTLTYNPKAAPAPIANLQVAPSTGIVVAIDAGHQMHGDNSLEPIGPGSSTRKAKVAGGASGVNAPHVPEYQLTLLVSKKVRDILQSKGITVVMIRETNDVNISNSRRAQIANEAHAALLVRVHFNAGAQSARGILTLYGAGNQWVDPYAAASKRAAQLIGTNAAAATGTSARYRGDEPHSDMTGLNWATVPSMIIEGGFLSNPEDNRLIVSDAYQNQLAQGIANGVMQYLGR
jgi:N-acetylmuramoyl-L-alanine amidase